MRKFDEKLQDHLQTATVFKIILFGIQNDINESLTAVMFEQRKSELSDWMYVAILLYKASDISCFSQHFTVRYVTKCSEVCERFIKFYWR